MIRRAWIPDRVALRCIVCPSDSTAYVYSSEPTVADEILTRNVLVETESCSLFSLSQSCSFPTSFSDDFVYPDSFWLLSSKTVSSNSDKLFVCSSRLAGVAGPLDSAVEKLVLLESWDERFASSAIASITSVGFPSSAQAAYDT